MRDVLETLERWAQAGTRVATATVVATERSSQREPGAVLAVDTDGDVVYSAFKGVDLGSHGGDLCHGPASSRAGTRSGLCFHTTALGRHGAHGPGAGFARRGATNQSRLGASTAIVAAIGSASA